MLKLGPDPRTQPIGDDGQAYFPAIPANFRAQDVPAWVESDTYDSVNPSSKVRLDGPSIDLTVRKKISQYTLAGSINDETGNPLPGVRVSLPEYHLETQTNQDGRFELQVKAESQQSVDLTAQKDGFQTAPLTPTLGDSRLNFSLKRNP